MFHSYAFDFSVWEMWGGLLYGGRVVVVSQMESRAPERFYELLQEQGVTVLNQRPWAFRQLMEIAEEKRLRMNLRRVNFGGAAVSPVMLAGRGETKGTVWMREMIWVTRVEMKSGE